MQTGKPGQAPCVWCQDSRCKVQDICFIDLKWILSVNTLEVGSPGPEGAANSGRDGRNGCTGDQEYLV